MNLKVLQNELESDPLGLGYASKSNEEIAAAMNAETLLSASSRFRPVSD